MRCVRWWSKPSSHFMMTHLDERVAEAKEQWLANAQEIIDEHVDQDALEGSQ